MTAGRPPRPIEQKRLLGNPGKRALPKQGDLVMLPALVDKAGTPEHFGPDGERIWRQAVEAAAAWLAPVDETVLRLLCEAADRRSDLLARIESDGPVLYTDKGYAYQNPAFGMVTSLETSMTKWVSQLGFTPTDRARLGLAEVKRASKLEQIMAARQARQSGSSAGT